jgi:hypothetical protein
MELEMMQDWLNNPEPVSDCHEKMLAEEHSKESLRIFNKGVEQLMKTAFPRHATDNEGEIQPKEQLEEAGDMPVREMVAAKLPQEEYEQ